MITREKYQEIIKKYQDKDDKKDPYLNGLQSYMGKSRLLIAEDELNITTFGEIKQKKG